MTQVPQPPKRYRQTRTARLARARLARHLHGFADDRSIWWRVQEQVPEAWATIEEDIDCEETKVKLTLRVDASVAKFYRAMGKGYQIRMNHILAAYARMKIGEIERERRGYGEIIKDYGVVYSEEVRQLYLSLRDQPDMFDAETRAMMDAAFGTKGF